MIGAGLAIAVGSTVSLAAMTPANAATDRQDRWLARVLDARTQAQADSAVAASLAEGTSDSSGNLQAILKRLRTRPQLAPRVNTGPSTTTTFGPTTGTTALVLYDTAGPYGFLGELYGMATANLAAHFGRVTVSPISSYQSGQIAQYDATIYLGSTYYSTNPGDGLPPNAIPEAFTSDVLSSSQPVIWVYDNIWTLGQRANTAGLYFSQEYGWDPTQSFFSPGAFDAVSYKGTRLTRFAGSETLPQSPVLGVNVTDGTALETLATAMSSADGTSVPWAVRSKTLTYIADMPFSFVNETDRYLAFADLLFDALAPQTPERHRALLRLEDITPKDDPAELRAVGEYLWEQRIPYSVAVIPVYKDPNGVYNNGKPETIALKKRPTLVKTLRWMVDHGATLVQHGYTHQLDNRQNPYSGVSADDFEFFIAHVDANDNVIYDGPVPQDSARWARNRIDKGQAAIRQAGLPQAQIWDTPHYAASAVDYGVIRSEFSRRFDRGLYFSGYLSGGPVSGTNFIGQFFPYQTTDVYGQAVLPENLGNYEPEAFNNHPPRFPEDLAEAAQANLVVRDGFASFFYHPYYGLDPLKDTVEAIRGLGYSFVAPMSVGF